MVSVQLCCWYVVSMWSLGGWYEVAICGQYVSCRQYVVGIVVVFGWYLVLLGGW